MNAIKRRTKTPVPAAKRRDAPNDAEIAHPLGTGLGPAIRLRRQESCCGTGRAHDHPALRTPVVGERRRVLDEIETQRPDEELDGGVIVVDHQRRELDMHRRKPNRVLCAR